MSTPAAPAPSAPSPVERYYLNGCWAGRPDSPADCGRRAASFLAALAQIDPLFAHWYKKGRSRKDALAHTVTPTEDALATLFRAGVARTDIDGTPMPELGALVSVWSGGAGREAVDVTFCCGAQPTRYSPLNNCVLRLPLPGTGAAARVLRRDTLVRLLVETARAWEPDWAAVVSVPYRDRYQAAALTASGRVPVLGWLLYLTAHRGRVPPLPAPARVIPPEESGIGGTIVILTDEPFTVSRSDHLAIAEAVRDCLLGARLLEPRD
jgi:hypothetical protein